MKKVISLALLFMLLATANAGAAVYLEIEDIEGESTNSSSAETTNTRTSSEQKAQFELQKSNDSSAETETGTHSGGGGGGAGKVQMSTEEEKKGNVEYGWKVEEGEKLEGTGIEPDEIDFMGDNRGGEKGGTEDINIGVGELLRTNLAILLSGGSDDEAEAEENRSEVAKIILAGLQEGDRPIETLSLNFEKISVQSRERVRLFGIIPTSAKATIEIDSEAEVKVKFPWWAVFASGKNSEELGQSTLDAIVDVLKARHDTVKNAISNVR